MCRFTCILTAWLMAIAPAALSATQPAAVVGPGASVDDPHGAPFASSTCAECHTCSNPTLSDPCLVICPRHGGHFFGKHTVDEGPDVLVIDQLANLYEPVIFAHKLHAGMAEMGQGCTSCHHYSEKSGAIPRCRSCHDVENRESDLRMPALKGAYHRQCINCHRDWSHENACGFCHAEADGDAADTVPDPTDIIGVPHPLIEATPTYTYDTAYEKGPVVTFHHTDHVEVFGQQCVDCHRGDSCARCHDTGADKAQAAHVDHVKSCFSCHASKNCAFCHDREPMPRFDHARSTGFDLAPYHLHRDCSACHSTPQNFRHPTGRCVDCHIHWNEGRFNHAVTGLTLNDDHADLECDNCHLDMDFTQRPSCDDCHDEPMLPAHLPGERR